jgi:parvulin-like peptidyl-prolyl isomerase
VWAGPIESGFGLHLVLVREKRDGALPDLAVIRAEVEGELLARRRTDEIDVTYARLLEKYEVVVESGDPPSRRAGSE